jgi:diacylglycerol kinase family enzyme
MLVVGNTRLYGGRFYLTPRAVANDGWLDLCVVKGRGPLALARQALPLAIFGSVTHADVEMLRVKELTVQADQPLPMQLDGELTGTTPTRFGVASRALHAIVPQNFTSSGAPRQGARWRRICRSREPCGERIHRASPPGALS